MEMTYTRGSLTFKQDNNGGYICEQLKALPEAFIAAYADKLEEIKLDIENRIAGIRAQFEIRYASKEEREKVSKTERLARGAEIFDTIIPEIRKNTESLKPMENLLFWLGDWWYYNTAIRSQIGMPCTDFVYDNNRELVNKYILPLLPEQVRENLKDVDGTSISVGFGHFAILFDFKGRSGVRRIVTDTQIFELHGVHGYIYLDITPEGKPIARSCCEQGGGRNFFDGVRLMSHDRFQTCAPKTVIINGGYKVNSTRCTIVSGMLFDLIDVDDKVAYTNGAFMGCCDFTNDQAVASYAMSEESGKLMRVEGDKVILNGEVLAPIGVFMPSRVKLLDNGFAHYDWSDFEKIIQLRYKSVLVVDDSQAWANKVVEKFGSKIKGLKVLITSDKKSALKTILEINPEALVLDMHLTEEEEFDGLWIARTLIKEGYKGQVMIASGYPEKQLNAMRDLIDDGIHIPGKDLAKLEACLTAECRHQR